MLHKEVTKSGLWLLILLLGKYLKLILVLPWRSTLPVQELCVRSLVGELSSYMPQVQLREKKKKPSPPLRKPNRAPPIQ